MDAAISCGFSAGSRIILDPAVELMERVVANGVIGVVKKFVVTLLVMRTFSHSQAHQWMPLFLVV